MLTLPPGSGGPIFRRSSNSSTATKERGRNRIYFPPLVVDMQRAQSIVAQNGGCCGSFNCFTRSLTLPEAAVIVYTCRQELQNVESRKKLIDKLRDKINQCVVRVQPGSNYLKMNYRIITETKLSVSIVHSVCKWTFMEAWGFNESLRKVLCENIKSGVVKTAHAITDRYSAVSGDFSKLVESCGLKDVITHPEKLNIAKLPNTEAAHYCYNWLENHFNLSGDNEPNSDEIHLDPVDKKEIYAEYANEAIIYKTKRVKKTQFNKIWRDCFPHVKIRKYKACSGKCAVCAELSIQTRKQKTRKAMEYIKLCRVIHRADFMRDRDLYAQRKKLAELYPRQYLSLITDGMQQTHCELPYSANRQTHGVNKLKQHLQGVTTHYRRTRMFRTLDHLFLGANACIYTLLTYS